MHIGLPFQQMEITVPFLKHPRIILLYIYIYTYYGIHMTIVLKVLTHKIEA